ncbi:signal peptidase I [Xanthomonas sp. NCPPB 2654]|uniref:signal peptidase I n=1 Tax=unclassified Xanthomonas TaxID=2643310 RepID=UPI0021E04916|nr:MULTISPECIES: signal peptidase I [unclassified Xanthomonas]MDL5364185.1 signal peptidase I [Xanthomonas sp. NCPPB 2654]UYC20514.1 signal peptidase I [Xanthomonas sp. CFBP 8443]
MTSTDPQASRLHRAASWTRKELLPIAVMLLLLTAARSSFANHYTVPSGSMQPTLQPGDRVAVDMSAYGLRVPFTEWRVLERGRPQRGDVAIFDSPRDGTRLIKRVVAVAGDRVDLRDGHLSINGQPLRTGSAGNEERFGDRIAQLDLDVGGGPDLYDVRVPPGKLLAIGDHRGNSLDGRYFGFVDADRVYGKALAVYYRRGEGLEWTRL